MPIVTRELKHVRPQRDDTVRVLEVLTAAVGHVDRRSYRAVSEAQAVIDMNARDVTKGLKKADFNDLLVFVEAPAKNNPDAFDFTNRDITLLEGEDFLFTHFAEGQGSRAILLAWWIKGMNPPTFNTIRDRLGLDVTDGDRVKDRAVALDDAEATFDDVVDVG